MRHLLFPLFFIAAPVQAETIDAVGKVTRVALFPWGASVVRQVAFTSAAGAHEVVVSGLPEGTDAEFLRVSGPDDVTVGAISLASGRLPVTIDRKSPEVVAAEAEVDRLEAVLRQRDAAIAAIRLRVDAATEQVAFLRGLGQGKAAETLGSATPDDLRALTKMVGEEVLAAHQAGFAAEQEAQAGELERLDEVEALQKAQQALAALTETDEEGAALTLAVQTVIDGPVSLEVTTYTDEAYWQPAYDLFLMRDGTPSLTLERSVVVLQESGEDWLEVELVLSTARPAEQSNPSRLWPQRLEIESEVERAKRMAEADSREFAGMAEPVMEPMVYESAAMELIGTTVTYRYPTPVDLRSGVDALRLRLDTLTVSPELRAVAVPSQDETAYLMADITNTTGEIILPGSAMLYLDGALVGRSELPLTAAGAKAEIGYGPIDGMRLTRTVPNRSEGGRGIIATTNQRDELAMITVENLTGQAWPLRVIDLIPYSEQDDLVVTYKATPPATTVDADGKRGMLSWDMDIGAGETREIRLEHSVSWPDGMVLK
ncbi:MAG: DUF4139 domain-containing protein [Albidovulum sp.]